MSNFSRIRLAGFWTANSVWDPAEAEDADAIRPLLANFGAGSTHAPSGFVEVGGAGFNLTGTGHQVAASARLTVIAGGEIRLPDTASSSTIPILRLNGTGGDLLLYVKSHISTLEAQSGSLVQVNAGAALDVFGGATIKSGGTFTANSGSTSAFASGSTTNLGGTTNITSTGTLSVLTGGGAIVVNSGGVLTVNGAQGYGATATIAYTNGCISAGVLTRQGREVLSGSSARTAYRPAATLSGSVDSDLTVANDRYILPSVLSASRVYTIRHTGTVPVAGERIRVSRISQVTPSGGGFTAKIEREDATILYSFYSGKQGFADFEFDGADWQCIAGAQYATASQSGYYDDVW